MVKKTKTNSTPPPQQQNLVIHLSTAITSNNQGDAGVTDKTTITPTSGILLVDVGENKTEKQGTTRTITIDSTVNDKATTTPTSGILLMDVSGDKTEKQAMTTTITTNPTDNDNDTTTKATSNKIWSPKPKKKLLKLSMDLVPATVTKTGSTKRTRSGGSHS